jgi:hypothetical protein
MAKQYSRKRKLDAQGVPFIFKLLLVTAFILSLSFLIMGYFVPTQGLVYRIITYVIFGVSFVIVFFVAIYNFVRSVEKVQTFDDMVFKALSRYLH